VGNTCGRPWTDEHYRHPPVEVPTPAPTPSEHGAITLVELMVCLMLLGLLGAVIVPLVSSFGQEDASIQHTYDAVDQLLQPAETLATYLHEAVAPAPMGSSATWSVFTAQTGPDEVQFTADVGPYGSTSDAGPFTVYGPALVTVAVQPGPNGTRRLVGTLQPAEAGTCPGVTTGSACQWGTPRPVLTVADLADGTANAPVFTYLEQGGTLTSTPSTTCTTAPGGCPLDQIEAVQYTIDTTDGTGLPGGTQSEANLLAPAYLASVG
jgi:type II secretory pathway pseudopilin PulG